MYFQGQAIVHDNSRINVHKEIFFKSRTGQGCQTKTMLLPCCGGIMHDQLVQNN